jgi:hypothetical protein
MAVIAAESRDAARSIFVEEFGVCRAGDFDSAQVKVIKGVDHPAGLVSYVYGGG